MIFDEDGIDLKGWQSAIDKGESADQELFIKKVKDLNLRNSIFVDITANESVSETYEHFDRVSLWSPATKLFVCFR
jgi:aspartokinase/homoserine dehydrogenase 1